MISSSEARVHSNLVLQERYFHPQNPALNPQLVTYTRGLDLSGSIVERLHMGKFPRVPRRTSKDL
jgi:hypothetical protein